MCQDSNTVQLHTKRYPDSPSTTEEMLNWEYHLLFITVDQKLKYPIWVRLWRTGTLIYCWWECKMEKKLETEQYLFTLHSATQLKIYFHKYETNIYNVIHYRIICNNQM